MTMDKKFNIEKIRVSVIIPIYNVEKYIDCCINSVISQTYKNIEIILVDDGSPDNCPAICDEYAKNDGRIKVIHKENQGLGEARNTGIYSATGDYIFFVDGDDYVKSDMISTCVLFAEKYGADVVHFGFLYVSDNQKTLKTCHPKSKKEFYCGAEIESVVIPSLIGNVSAKHEITDMCFSFCSMMIKRTILTDANFKCASEREIISEDFYSILDFYKNVKSCAIVSEPFYCYRQNPSSLSHLYREDRLEKNNEFFVKCSAFLEEKGYSENIIDGISRAYLGNLIGYMKQLVFCQDKAVCKEKLKIISSDEIFKKAYKKHNKKSFSFLARTFYKCLIKGKIDLCYFILKIKGNK